MKLQILLNALKNKKVSGVVKNTDAKGIAYDPLRVKKNFIYVAIDVYTQLDKVEIPDGHLYVKEAIKSGACAIVVQEDIETPSNIIKIIVPNARLVLGILSDKFYGHPSAKMKMIGVTGTNGKTTTTHLIESILLEKYKVGLIGTLYYKINDKPFKSKDTTPEPADLQEILTKMVKSKVSHCALEVSSHGIEFHRIHGINFDVAVFTNLSQDHLDYHKTMKNYMDAKLKLFRNLEANNFAIINNDDVRAKYFKAVTRAKILTYGLKNKSDITTENIKFMIHGTTYKLITPIGSININSKLAGKFNIYNSLAAVGVALSQKIDLKTIKAGLEKNIKVAGRFQLVPNKKKFAVVVDYAHSPDGMEKVLSLAKSLKPKRIITIFGAGGDRDPKKRPLMGAVADKYSDTIIVTSDNPRTENPNVILKHISAGIKNKKFFKILDRKKAIQFGIKLAKEGDIVMILGKGHETTQILKDKVLKFNDYEVAKNFLLET